jgi:hypothetical protein
MHIISHRINTLDQLKNTPSNLGVEVDIRSYGENLIMHHDPFKQGECFEDWLKSYQHGTLILNVKEEGLEGRLLSLMAQHNIEDFFFLDQSFPFLRRTVDMGEKRCAVRVSEYESIETTLSLSGMVEWVWVDCFTRFPLSSEEAAQLKSAGFKLCFVSPELQGRTERTHVMEFRRKIELLSINGDAVCTKYPDLWG